YWPLARVVLDEILVGDTALVQRRDVAGHVLPGRREELREVLARSDAHALVGRARSDLVGHESVPNANRIELNVVSMWVRFEVPHRVVRSGDVKEPDPRIGFEHRRVGVNARRAAGMHRYELRGDRVEDGEPPRRVLSVRLDVDDKF